MSHSKTQPAQPEHYSVPFAGAWQLGQPLPKLQPSKTVQMIDVPTSIMLRERVADFYAVQVQGDAPDMLVADKDVLLVRETTEWNDGQMLLVRVAGEDFLIGAQLWREGDQIRLQPARAGCWVRRVSADEVAVDALVIAVIRRMTE